jgi:signal transduction histidine kinase
VRVPLSLRIFVAHLAFTVAVGAAAAWSVQLAFDDYFRSWKERLETVPAEAIFQPLAQEVGRSLLLQEDELEEVREQNQARIAEGLRSVLKGIPSVDSVLIVDTEDRIQYASQPDAVDLAFRDNEEMIELLRSDKTERRTFSTGGQRYTRVMVPIWDSRIEGREPEIRLGSVVVTYRPDPALVARIPDLKPQALPPKDYVKPLIALLALAGAGGLVITLFAIGPIRRLDRALEEYRRKGYRGDFRETSSGLGREFASTVEAISELGGRLEAMDGRGRERESLLATLSQTLEDGMLALGPAGEPVAWNTAAVRLLCGVSSSGGDEAECLRSAMAAHPQLRSGGASGTASFELEVDRGNDGKLAVGVTRVPLELRPGEEGALVLVRDLATFRKVELHLVEAGRFATLASLAGGLAHEIRNPLHSIGLNAGVVEQYLGQFPGGPSHRAVEESLRAIQDETRRLTDLLNNYLGMLRSGEEPGLVDLREVCERVLQLLAFVALKARVELRLEGDDELPLVRGMRDRIQQAILNLVLNAIQAMPDGGVVTLITGVAEGHVRVTVSDTGPGLPEDLASTLFETRVTTKPGGSGLGLPLVRLIAEAHGGSVSCRSRPGQGAAFTLVLPVEDEAA